MRILKKFFNYFILFIFICFIFPAILTNNRQNNKSKQASVFQDAKENSGTEKNELVENYNYKNYGTVKLLHTKTGKIEEVSIDDYLCNVVSAEMPASFEQEALKAQAIVARTYTIYKINNKKHDNADICDSSLCCQAWISKEDRLSKWDEDQRQNYWEKISNAVNSTKGKIITYNNAPINAFFHANSGGTTEVPKEVWGGTNYPYLQVVQTSGEEGYTQYSSEVKLTYEELNNKLKEKYSDIQINFENDDDIKILEYTNSNRVKTIKFGNHELSRCRNKKYFRIKICKF